MRALLLGAALMCAGCTAPLVGGTTTLQQAAGRYPPLIIGANTTSQAGPVELRACPAPGGRVEQKGGPTIEFLGAVPGQPTLCRMRVEGSVVEGWYGIWLTDWPGAEQGRAALANVIAGGTGAVDGFDIRMDKGFTFHDLIRNEGVERIKLLGQSYDALKISHYREGFDGNIYRSVATVWKDIPSGLLIYATYQHISGTPVIDDPLIPTAIISAR